MDVGDSIRSLREGAGITQEQLGKIAGVSPNAVSQWENKRAVPRMGAIQRMADYFGVPKSLIMGDRNSTTETLSVDERALLVLFRSCNKQGKINLLEYAEDTARRHPKNNDNSASLQAG